MHLLNGNWKYTEEFDFGSAIGTVHITQNGTSLQGFAIIEEIENDESFIVRLSFTGLINKREVEMMATHFEIMSSKKDLNYNLDTWHGIINSEGIIVGHTMDEEGVYGVFTMKRHQDD